MMNTYANVYIYIYIYEIRYRGATVVRAFTPAVILPTSPVRQTDVLGTQVIIIIVQGYLRTYI